MDQETEKIKSFTDLRAWQEGHVLVLAIYSQTKNFPREEQFGLVNQLRRAAVSVTSNIAEGFSRNTYKDKVNFYIMALGSLTEAENQLLIARDVRYLSEIDFQKLANQAVIVSKILNGLIKKSRLSIRNS